MAGTDLGTLRSTSQVMEGLLIHHGSGSCDVDVNCPSAQGLLEYFVQKIKTIRLATGDTPATTKLSPSVNIFSNFEIFSTEDVRKLIMPTRSKSCSLDPIPTEILKELLLELLPFITDMCNKSMQEGCLPASQACHHIPNHQESWNGR